MFSGRNERERSRSEALACYDLALSTEFDASLRPYSISPEGAYDTHMRRAELLEDLGRQGERADRANTAAKEREDTNGSVTFEQAHHLSL